MPLTRADMEQIDAYIKSGEIRLARRMLEDNQDDPRAVKALAKFNQQYPPQSAPVSRPASVPTPPPVKAAPVFVSPTLTDLAPDIARDEMADVRLAIREKRYDDAEALLILSDHPDAEKLRERLAQVRGKPLTTRKVKTPASTGSTVRRAVIAFLVLTVIGVGGTLFVLRQIEIAQRPEKIYDQLLGVCFNLALQNDDTKRLPDSVLGRACDATVREYIATYPAIALQCYLESGGGTLEWYACDANDYAEFNYDYLVEAVNLYVD